MEAMTCNPGPDRRNDVDRLDEPPLAILPENGVYTIIISLRTDTEVHVGSLGIIKMEKGFYAYTGSGLGRRALSLRGRVLRHLKRDKRLKWHIDYLTSNDMARIIGVVASEAEKSFECKVASHLNEVTRYIKRFGCSDCKCVSHLAILPCLSEDECLSYVESVYKKLGLTPRSLRL
ncbi:MAG: GIY-YIG nuclease family protein [Thermoprotei archaeon]|nr:MAG: GIY-YIG nuclease family protein [Thermoprotei archaeon]